MSLLLQRGFEAAQLLEKIADEVALWVDDGHQRNLDCLRGALPMGGREDGPGD